MTDKLITEAQKSYRIAIDNKTKFIDLKINVSRLRGQLHTTDNVDADMAGELEEHYRNQGFETAFSSAKDSFGNAVPGFMNMYIGWKN